MRTPTFLYILQTLDRIFILRPDPLDKYIDESFMYIPLNIYTPLSVITPLMLRTTPPGFEIIIYITWLYFINQFYWFFRMNIMLKTGEYVLPKLPKQEETITVVKQ